MRIEIGEIENALQSVAGVLNAAVVLDVRDNRERLIGFVQGDDDVAAIRRQVAELLPAFMLPDRLFHCHQIPLNAAGKVDKNQLRFLASTLSVSDAEQWQAPAGDAENALASLWADVLNVPVESIGRNSDFFALGGNSLLAMSAAIRSAGRFSLADIFALRTLDRLANAQASTTDNVLQALTPEKRESVLVCFSYAGGNAVNFQNVANALYRLTQTTVYGVEPPGNDLSRREGGVALSGTGQPKSQGAAATRYYASQRMGALLGDWGRRGIHSPGAAVRNRCRSVGGVRQAIAPHRGTGAADGRNAADDRC